MLKRTFQRGDEGILCAVYFISSILLISPVPDLILYRLTYLND